MEETSKVHDRQFLLQGGRGRGQLQTSGCFCSIVLVRGQKFGRVHQPSCLEELQPRTGGARVAAALQRTPQESRQARSHQTSFDILRGSLRFSRCLHGRRTTTSSATVEIRATVMLLFARVTLFEDVNHVFFV